MYVNGDKLCSFSLPVSKNRVIYVKLNPAKCCFYFSSHLIENLLVEKVSVKF